MKKCNYITPFRLCVLENFPFIESDFDAVTDYELLCKIVEYLNKVITNENCLTAEMQEIILKLNEALKWIDDFDTSYAESVLKKYLATMIFVEISTDGYIIYNIPEDWKSINFNTTGLDIDINGEEYGKLVLSY